MITPTRRKGGGSRVYSMFNSFYTTNTSCFLDPKIWKQLFNIVVKPAAGANWSNLEGWFKFW